MNEVFGGDGRGNDCSIARTNDFLQFADASHADSAIVCILPARPRSIRAWQLMTSSRLFKPNIELFVSVGGTFHTFSILS